MSNKQKESALIVSQQCIAADIYSMWIQTEKIATLAVPGQFISMYTKDGSKDVYKRQRQAQSSSPTPDSAFTNTIVILPVFTYNNRKQRMPQAAAEFPAVSAGCDRRDEWRLIIRQE